MTNTKKTALLMRTYLCVPLLIALISLPVVRGAQSYPENQKIVYERGGNELYTFHPGGQEVESLTEDYNGFHPSLSPDGSKIAFVSLRDKNREIYIMNTDGSNQRRLTRSETDDDYPCWTPDSRSIIWVSNGRDIYRMMLNGYILETVKSGTSFPKDDFPRSVSVAKNGFVGYIGSVQYGFTRKNVVSVIERIGFTPTVRYKANDKKIIIAWMRMSSDGQRFAFSTIVDSKNSDGKIYVMDTGEEQYIADGYAFGFSWSPDGQKLAYTDLDHKIRIYDLSTHEESQTGIYGYVVDWVDTL